MMRSVTLCPAVFTVTILWMCLAQPSFAQRASNLPGLQSPVTSIVSATPGTANREETVAPTTDADTVFINQILQILGEAVITRLDARVSLESAKVDEGRIRLQGVLLQNLDIGLRLNAGGAHRLAEAIQRRYGRSATASSASTNSSNQWAQLLEIAKLGLFNRIEVSVRLRELRVRRLSLNARALNVQGALLQVGATPNDPLTGKPRSDTFQTLLDLLRRTALTRIKAHAGLDRLAARRLNLVLEGVRLQGLAVGITLARQDDDQNGQASPQTSSSKHETVALRRSAAAP